jgi:hypothetical protein
LFNVITLGLTLIDDIKPWANLINVLAAFLKPACVQIFSADYFDSNKKFKHLNFLSAAQKQPQAIGH